MHTRRLSTYLITAVAAAAMAVAVVGWTSHAEASRNDVAAASHSSPVAPASAPAQSTAPTPTTTASPPSASHRAAIDSMLLRAEDVPSAYSESPQPFSNSEYPFYDAACGEIPSSTVKDQVMFQKGLFGPFIYNSVAVYNNVDALFKGYAKATQTCGRDSEKRSDDSSASVSFTETSFPTIGDRTFAASFSGTAAGLSYSGELVLVSKGDLASVIVILGSPPADTSQLETYARAVEGRMSS